MNWLTNFVRPKIRALVGSDIPENLWIKCEVCEQMIFHKELHENFNVCKNCNNHLSISVNQRIEMLFENSKFSRLKVPETPQDPLKFKDSKKYIDRLKTSKAATNENDAVVVGYGKIGPHKVTACIFNFEFMGGSMGTAVGEAFISAVNHAIESSSPFLVVTSSGGARMQEGILSLMQMPRTIFAIHQLKLAKLPYIVLLTNPTTGGVSASFAMLGDIHMAEPGAIIAFTGPRVIEATIREKLPDGFQKSEYLQDHGMVDFVVHRSQQKEMITRILSILKAK